MKTVLGGLIPITPVASPQLSVSLRRWQGLAAAGCFAVACLLVFLIHPEGDGSWYWYTVLFRSGRHIYSQLHLALQPLLVLEIACFQKLFGMSWIASLFVGLWNASLFLASLILLNRFNSWRDWQKAILLFCAFVTTADFPTIRFDDYHVMSAGLVVYALVCLLYLDRTSSERTNVLLLIATGVVCGICITNRINDGGALLGTVLVVVTLLRQRGRLYSAAVVALAAVVSALSVVLLTGDSARAWWEYSIVRAAAIKGGAGSVLVYPIGLPRNTWHLLMRDRRTMLMLVCILLLTTAWAIVERRGQREDGTWNKWLILLTTFLSLATFRRAWTNSSDTAVVCGCLGIFALLLTGVWVLYRVIRFYSGNKSGRPPLELLLWVPLGQLLSISMSSGQWFPNPFPSLACFLILLPIAAPKYVFAKGRRAALIAFVSVTAVACCKEKISSPFHWWDYESTSMSTPHSWYQHPVYGAMWIETSQLNFIRPVCETIKSESGDDQPQLLSLPFPYANYFCAIPPWHEYVQTFFDTSSEQTINRLRRELETHPPQWIFYQRQPYALRKHEIAFRHGQPLPHRYLDELIMGKLASGAWKLVKEEDFPAKGRSQWLLIQTR